MAACRRRRIGCSPDQADDWRHVQHALGWGQLYYARTYVGPLAHMLLGVGAHLLGTWTVMALGAALAMMRSSFVGVGVLGSVMLLVGLLVSLYQKGPFLLVLPVVCLALTLAAFAAAHRRHLMSGRMIVVCSAIYLLLCIVPLSAVAQMRVGGSLSVYEQFILAGICAAPFAPLAAAPLALSWNRHR